MKLFEDKYLLFTQVLIDYSESIIPVTWVFMYAGISRTFAGAGDNFMITPLLWSCAAKLPVTGIKAQCLAGHKMRA